MPVKYAWENLDRFNRLEIEGGTNTKWAIFPWIMDVRIELWTKVVHRGSFLSIVLTNLNLTNTAKWSHYDNCRSARAPSEFDVALIRDGFRQGNGHFNHFDIGVKYQECKKNVSLWLKSEKANFIPQRKRMVKLREKSTFWKTINADWFERKAGQSWLPLWNCNILCQTSLSWHDPLWAFRTILKINF